MKNKCFLSLICVLLSLASFSQNAVNKDISSSDAKTKSFFEEMIGTYVLIPSNPNVKASISMETLRNIESRRDDKKEILFLVGDLTIKILPRNVINAPDFDPKKYQ